LSTDLIAAVATGSARTAIGIIRLSGAGAAACAGRLFRAAGKQPLAAYPPRKLVYGVLLDGVDGKPIDKVLATWSPAGSSYTGEETAELQCHGSPQVLAMALEALFAQGARQAGPGEFTQRAFLNGKLDLPQAEAVMDLIDAGTPQAVRQAAGQLSGALSRRVEAIYSSLLDVMAHFHAVLDYPDEDIDPFEAEKLERVLSQTCDAVNTLLQTYERGRITREGVPCAIVGPPNAGKSSLLNALVGYERAIVTDIPGTTRDTVEEVCVLGGVLLRLVDTAGLREASDMVEKLGVARSRTAMKSAGLLLVVLDRSIDTGERALSLLREAISDAPTILVWNKCDLPAAAVSPAWMEALPEPPPTVSVSAKTGRGLDQLAHTVSCLFPTGVDKPGEVLTNVRQAEAARRAGEALQRARQALQMGVTPDAVLVDVEEALSALGELTGRTIREDVTARIFERFCVGK